MLQWISECTYLFEILISPLNIYPEVGWLVYGSSIRILGNFHTFILVSVPIYIATNSIKLWPLFSPAFTTFYGSFKKLVILAGVGWYLIKFLVASLIVSDVQHFSQTCQLIRHWRNVYLVPLLEFCVFWWSCSYSFLYSIMHLWCTLVSRNPLPSSACA